MNERLASQPWALQLEALHDLCRTQRRELPQISGGEQVADSPRDQRIIEYLGLGDPEPEDMGAGIRLIRLEGTLMKRPSVEERYFYGARDVDAFRRQMLAAQADLEVRAVILTVDSPGGQIVGTPEAGGMVRNFSKPLAVYTDSLMASGAYWIGSQARAVYASPSAMVGSIGVYLPVLDVSGMMERFGVKVDLIKAGKHKAAGYPGTQLSAEQRAFIQERVDGIHAEFRAAVRSRRVSVADSSMEGQVFDGREAARLGLVTGLSEDLGEIARKLLS